MLFCGTLFDFCPRKQKSFQGSGIKLGGLGMTTDERDDKQMASGVPGLDTLLGGGFRRGRTYLINGIPGTGKTTLAMQFLLEGKKNNERSMLASLIETREELEDMANSHGWSLENIELLQIPHETRRSATSVQTVFNPGEVEFSEVAESILEAIERYRPQRLVLDSVSQFALMSDSWYQLRGPILEIKQLSQKLGCTILFISSGAPDSLGELETIVHGSVTLKSKAPAYGQVSRNLIVNKLRGSIYPTGYHNFRIRTGGIEIYAWPVSTDQSRTRLWEVLPSGIEELDTMLSGGLESGTSCLISGTTGTGKSTLATLYLQSAAKRGDKSVAFCFDERKETFLRRSDSLGIDIRASMEKGLMSLYQVEVGVISPGEFAQMVRRAVEEKDAKVVLIDSLSGYLSTMPGDDDLLSSQLHELLNYLGSEGVLTLMVVNRHDAGNIVEWKVDASYIADTIVHMRHFEAFGEMRRCITVLKKRHGDHEKNIREFQIGQEGCQVGEPLTKFSGIMSGTPTFHGKAEKLIDE